MGDEWSLGNGFPTQDTTIGLLACIECTVCSEITCFFISAATLA
jgi:hypothetical protein